MFKGELEAVTLGCEGGIFVLETDIFGAEV
jgi:hypothetical protein